jgi:hypothetical protein
MRITAIEALTVLSPDELELLEALLAGAPQVDRAALVVYRVTGDCPADRSVVAPTSEALRVGMTVICSGWERMAQKASTDSPTTIEVHVAKALAPLDSDA